MYCRWQCILDGLRRWMVQDFDLWKYDLQKFPKCSFGHTWSHCSLDLWSFDLKL